MSSQNTTAVGNSQPNTLFPITPKKALAHDYKVLQSEFDLFKRQRSLGEIVFFISLFTLLASAGTAIGVGLGLNMAIIPVADFACGASVGVAIGSLIAMAVGGAVVIRASNYLGNGFSRKDIEEMGEKYYAKAHNPVRNEFYRTLHQQNLEEIEEILDLQKEKSYMEI